MHGARIGGRVRRQSSTPPASFYSLLALHLSATGTGTGHTATSAPDYTQRAPPTDPASRLELIIDTLHALMHPWLLLLRRYHHACMCYLLVFFRDCPPARLIMAWTTPRTVQFRRLLDASVMSRPFDFDQHPCITVWDPYICTHVY
jgi:hypothetical protein